MFETQQAASYWTAQVTVPQLNAGIAASFQTAFSKAVAQHHGPVVLDLSEVDFIDSSGLAALVFCFKSLALREDLLLCSLNQRVVKVLETTHIDHVLRIFPSKQDAIAALRSS